MKLYEDDRINFLKEKLNEGNAEPRPPQEWFVNDRLQATAEKIYVSYLTDRTLQTYNYEIIMLMNTATSMRYKYDGENLIPLFPPDRAYEIKRIMNIRDEYIRLYYPELIVEEEKK
jgi:hypothetical protein